MNTEHKNFIGLYRDVYPEGYCQHLIEQFEHLCEQGASVDRLNGEGALAHRKQDNQICISLKGHNIDWFNDASPVNMFFDGLQKCFEVYSNKYSSLKEDRLRASHMKMQRTDPGGGYHIWHCEQGKDAHAGRAVVYMLYLNTLASDQAGETEFLYQQTRYQPVENTMILWPAGYTHLHRGNTVFGEKSKYVVTGWFYHD